MLATDKQLENELEFDLRRFENDEDGWYRQPEADPKVSFLHSMKY